ncbi:DinB family protein [Longimicrobium sp.]|uniref:DinB family protein n=1 Tax=Longimicrobium sp. TaxID=2029185 RepID=UPI002BB19124|nr:DinB family protein [Longimicrobium sp.]HSU12877.1 DinB family protein [Longimicrobium sp.]
MPTILPPTLPLSPLLQGYLDELAAIRRDAEELTAGLTGAQFGWRPEPAVWSVGQIVRHLTVSGRSYADALRPALAAARARGSADRGDFRPSLVGGLMVRWMEPPPRMRFKAPRIWRPAGAGGDAADRTREMADWRALHDAFEETIRAAAGLDLRRIRIVSPASRLVRMNAGDALALILAHERRHLWQMRRVKEHAGFPAG